MGGRGSVFPPDGVQAAAIALDAEFQVAVLEDPGAAGQLDSARGKDGLGIACSPRRQALNFVEEAAVHFFGLEVAGNVEAGNQVFLAQVLAGIFVQRRW